MAAAMMSTESAPVMRRLCLILIKPSHYDDDGYVIQWLRSTIPSNSLAALYGLARDCAERRVFGDDVEVEIHFRLRHIYLRVKRDPNKLQYIDVALTPVTDHDLETLEMFHNPAAEAFAAREQSRHIREPAAA
jgi:hypothetical protein